MKYLIWFVGFFFVACQEKNTISQENEIDFTPYWDTLTPLPNPNKGWYHHLLDNGINAYSISDQDLLQNFPGMDHMYLRLAWSYLEPEEGKFDWTIIDKAIAQYVPKGYGISFRITCKETGEYPSVVAQQQDGVNYATPIWVKEAGAKGTVVEAWNVKSWNPVWDDPVYLEKLNNFHKAFAKRYDHQPFVRYADVGSIGDWGEGHTSFSTKIPPTVEEVKAHMDLYRKHYKNTMLVVTDDLLYYGKSREEENELLKYALDLGFTLRDDSPLVDWYIHHYLETYSVSHPHLFDKSHDLNPIVYELQHYHIVKRDGNWVGKNGEEKIEGKDYSGADLFRESMRTLRATYIGYHGYMEEWYRDNPDLTAELLNMSGYWFFPKTVRHIDTVKKGEPFEFSVEWMNKGVSRAYDNYSLWVKLERNNKQYIIQLDNAKPYQWLPDSLTLEKYSINLPEEITPGEYKIKLKLTTSEKEKRPVQLGLQKQILDSEGFYELFLLNISK